MFYLPKVESEEIKRLEGLIVRWGGLVLDTHECMGIQIRPTIQQGGFSTQEYYCGQIYMSNWIEDSISQNKVIPPNTYIATKLDSSYDVKVLNLGKRKKFTILEGIRLYEAMVAQKWNKVKTEIWNKLHSNDILPGRTIDSMKNFWKRYSEVTLEDFLIESFQTGRDYCITYKKVPDPSIEQSFRDRFANDFENWEERRAAGLINLD